MSVTVNDNPTYHKEASDGTSWRGSRGQQLNVGTAVPSYRQATTTYRAPADAEDASNPSYRVATDEVGVPRKPGAEKDGGGSSFMGEHRMLLLIVLCIVLGVLCVILLALAINYGIAYQGALKATAAPAVGRVGDYTGPTTTTTTIPQTASLATGTSVKMSNLGPSLDGQSTVSRYTLTNSQGMQAELISYGARVNALRIPAASGLVDVVAGSNDSNIANFQQSKLGSVNGRVCSAIPWRLPYGGSTFEFNKQSSTDPFYTNGGTDGFYTRNFNSHVDGQNRVHFLYNSSSGADGIPGLVWVHAIYELTASNELIVTMTLETDTASPVDMCNSVAFNLGGPNNADISGHMMQLFTTTTAIDKSGAEVTPSPDLQFQTPTDIFNNIQKVINYINVYDYTFSAIHVTGKALLARVSSSATNIAMEVYSNQPALRVFVPRLNVQVQGKYGMNYTGMAYFMAQPQLYPVANVYTDQNKMKTLILSPKSEYRQETSYKFYVN